LRQNYRSTNIDAANGYLICQSEVPVESEKKMKWNRFLWMH